MAIAIAPTPILKNEDAVNFTKKIEEDLKKPATLVPTPKIETARKLINEYISKNKEQL